MALSPSQQPSVTQPASTASASAGKRRWSHSHLLDLKSLSVADLQGILAATDEYACQHPSERFDTLKGVFVANLFFEDSTRTRLSFSIAAKRLGADVIDLTGPGSSISKGETLADTARNVVAMGASVLVVRHSASGAAKLVADAAGCTVINAGDGTHQHPTQGLLDTYTLARAHNRTDTFDLSGLTVAIVGDIASSRVARSNIAALTTLGARVICVGPPSLCPPAIASLGCEVSHDLDDVIDNADLAAINMLRIQHERHLSPPSQAPLSSSAHSLQQPTPPLLPSLRQYTASYCLNEARAARLPAGCIVMHPGPINRSVEIMSTVADGPRSVILTQVAHGVAVRMAALQLCLHAASPPL